MFPDVGVCSLQLLYSLLTVSHSIQFPITHLLKTKPNRLPHGGRNFEAVMRLTIFLLFMVFFFPHSAHADYASGKQAYEAGKVQEAFRAWQESAQEGEAQSQYQLGNLYEEGMGTIQNFVLAHVFYNLAASQGQREARDARNALAGKMSKEQLAEAQQLAAQWQAAPSAPAPAQAPVSAPPTAPPPAVAHTPDTLWMAVEAGDGARVQAILQSGVDVNSTNPDGWTPLMRAALQGNVAMVSVLIGAKAEVNHHSSDGTTALLAATLPGHLEVVKALIDAGADASQTNTAGVTARFIAEKKGHGEIAKLLTPPVPEGMVEIPARAFTMGLDPAAARAEIERLGGKVNREEFINNASPVHEVVLDAFFIDKYPVRPGHRAIPRRSLRPVAAFTVTGGSGYESGFQIDAADGMAFGIGDVNAAVLRPANSLRSIQQRQLRRTAVARPTLRSRARNMVQRLGLPIDPVNHIAFPQRQIKVALGVGIYRPWTIQRRPRKRCPIGRRLLFPGAGPGADKPRLHIDTTNAVVGDIADQQAAIGIELNAVRLIQKRLLRRTAIA